MITHEDADMFSDEQQDDNSCLMMLEKEW